MERRLAITPPAPLRDVANCIADADALLITAGAGMSADSGLPVFRGNEGFWAAYPPLRHLGISFERMAQPHLVLAQPTHGLGLLWSSSSTLSRCYPARWVTSCCAAGPRACRVWRLRAHSTNVDGQFTAAPASQAMQSPNSTAASIVCSAAVLCSSALWDAPDGDLEHRSRNPGSAGRAPRTALAAAALRGRTSSCSTTTPG